MEFFRSISGRAVAQHVGRVLGHSGSSRRGRRSSERTYAARTRSATPSAPKRPGLQQSAAVLRRREGALQLAER